MTISPRPSEKPPLHVGESHVQDLLRWAEARPVQAEAIAERWDEIYLDHVLAVYVWDQLKWRYRPAHKVVAEVIATLRPSLAVRESPKFKTRREQRS